jgi:selenium metabolism protein YedF
MKELDVRNLACPGPVLKLRELLEAGEREVRFHVADELCRSNVTRFARSRGAAIEVEDGGDGSFFISITAGDSSEAAVGAPTPLAGDLADVGPVGLGSRRPQIVQVTGSTMGAGDDELGTLLLRSFLKTQAQLDQQPDAVIFYNNGVKLCCEDSQLLDDLRALERAGVEIIACGTCLNFFGLADRLAVGRVTDMLEIAGLLATAGSIVRP